MQVEYQMNSSMSIKNYILTSDMLNHYLKHKINNKTSK